MPRAAVSFPFSFATTRTKSKRFGHRVLRQTNYEIATEATYFGFIANTDKGTQTIIIVRFMANTVLIVRLFLEQNRQEKIMMFHQHTRNYEKTDTGHRSNEK